MKKTKILLLILLLSACALVLRIAVRHVAKGVFPLRYEAYIEKYADEYGLDKYLVMGVICAESKFDPAAHSGVAKGLMQITDDTARWLAERLDADFYEDMAYEPEVGISMGCYYLAYLMGIYENEDTALAAYNAGMGNVGKWLADESYSTDGRTLFDIPYEETKKYVKRVRRLEAVYKKLY